MTPMLKTKTHFQSPFDNLSKACALLGFLTVLIFSTGCASSGTSTVRQPFSTKLGQFKSASVKVSSSIAKPPTGLNEFMAQLEARIVAKLREKQILEKVYSHVAAGDSKPDLDLFIVITSVRDVTSFDRVMWGAMAGQATTKATVAVRNRASGELIGSGDIEGKSSGGSVFAGTTTEAVDRVADEVVKLIESNR